MCLIDTIDGALMMTVYTSTSLARDIIAILYYSIVLTAITVLVATCIGVIQLLMLVANVAKPQGPFWDGMDVVSDHYDIVGGAICGAFLIFGVLSVIVYKPWRRRVDQNRNGSIQNPSALEIVELGSTKKGAEEKVPQSLIVQA